MIRNAIQILYFTDAVQLTFLSGCFLEFGSRQETLGLGIQHFLAAPQHCLCDYGSVTMMLESLKCIEEM